MTQNLYLVLQVLTVMCRWWLWMSILHPGQHLQQEADPSRGGHQQLQLEDLQTWPEWLRKTVSLLSPNDTKMTPYDTKMSPKMTNGFKDSKFQGCKGLKPMGTQGSKYASCHCRSRQEKDQVQIRKQRGQEVQISIQAKGRIKAKKASHYG